LFEQLVRSDKSLSNKKYFEQILFITIKESCFSNINLFEQKFFPTKILSNKNSFEQKVFPTKSLSNKKSFEQKVFRTKSLSNKSRVAGGKALFKPDKCSICYSISSTFHYRSSCYIKRKKGEWREFQLWQHTRSK
jgi:hypothetical protein